MVHCSRRRFLALIGSGLGGAALASACGGAAPTAAPPTAVPEVAKPFATAAAPQAAPQAAAPAAAVGPNTPLLTARPPTGKAPVTLRFHMRSGGDKSEPAIYVERP